MCLSATAGKVKPLDMAMVAKLEQEFNLGPETRRDVFSEIMAAKEDVSGGVRTSHRNVNFKLNFLLFP